MVKVLKKKNSSNSTDFHLQVKSLSDFEIYDWDAEKIITALTKECKLKREDAKNIADKVYNELLEKNKKEIDVQTLKTIINYHLFLEGYNGAKLSGQVSVGMSLYDLDSLIKDKSAENSNISNNNPEAVALTVSENTFKKYALKKVFSKDVANAHLEGLIHLHDLGECLKIYSVSSNMVINVKIGNNEKTMKLINLWNTFNDVEEKHLVDNHYERDLKDKNVYTKDRSKWVKIERLVLIKEKKNMYEFITYNGKIKVSEEHGCIVKRDDNYIIIRADEVLKTDKFIKVA